MDAQDLSALTTLLSQAEQARDAARQRLLDAERAERQGTAQAEQLGDYRIETQNRWALQSGQAAAIEIMLCYRSFMDRLEQALTQQEQVCAQAERQVALARAALAESEMRVASVRKLIERRQQALQRVEQRLDQKRLDEAGQRAAWIRQRQIDSTHH